MGAPQREPTKTGAKLVAPTSDGTTLVGCRAGDTHSKNGGFENGPPLAEETEMAHAAIFTTLVERSKLKSSSIGTPSLEFPASIKKNFPQPG